MNDITRILESARAGDKEAADELLAVAYEELRCIAAAKMAGERAGHTLQPTALVHEAYVRLLGPDGEQPKWGGRGHFFAAVAEAMRRILIESARRRQSLKRGGDQQHTVWEDEKFAFETVGPPEELIAVDEALAALEAENPAAAEVVKLRYFTGMSIDETASALEMSPRTVDRTWRGAKVWLKKRIAGSE
ncbi:MAG: sigma-70 family RNA polymerase sigma factor [Verrucomicrobiales bacterium]